MAHDAPADDGQPTKLVIRNIGLMLSGALENPILDADTIVAENGRITAIGREKTSTPTRPQPSSTPRVRRCRLA